MTSSLAHQVVVALVLALVVLAPGGALLCALGWHRRLPSWLLVPAAAWTLSGVLTAVAVASILLLHVPLAVAIVELALVTLACAAWTLRRRLRGRVTKEQLAGAPTSRELGAWTAGLALVAVLGFALGGHLAGDTLFHVAVSQKLLAFSDPSISNLQMFEGGGPHAGYLLPAMHAQLAIAAGIAGIDVGTVYFVAPAVLLPLVASAFAGLGAALVPWRHAGWACAALAIAHLTFVSMNLFFWLPSIVTWPGYAMVYIGMPLFTAVLVGAFESFGAGGRPWWQVAQLGAVIALCTVLHNSYVPWLGLLVGGLLVGWLLLGDVRRTWRGVALLCGVLLAIMAVLLGIDLAIAEQLGSLPNERGTMPRSEFEALAAALVGAGPESFHLRSANLVPAGALAILGLLGTTLAATVRARGAAQFIAGSTLLVIVVTQVDPLFTALAAHVSPRQALRVYNVLPVELGLLLLVFAIASALASRRPARVAATIAGVLAAAWVLRDGRSLIYRFDDPRFPEWTVTAAMAVVVSVVVIGAIVVRIRARGHAGAEGAGATVASGRSDVPIARAAPGALAAMAALTLVLGAAHGQVVPAAREMRVGITERPETAYELGRFRFMPMSMRRTIAELEPGIVVLSDAATSYRIMALAPVYVVGSDLGHTHDTKTNPGAARAELVEILALDDGADRQRDAALRELGVDAVLVPRRFEAPPLAAWASRRAQLGTLELVAEAGGFRLYRRA